MADIEVIVQQSPIVVEVSGATGPQGPPGSGGGAEIDGNLLAIDGLTMAADKLIYFTSSSAAATSTVTSFARGLLDDTDASTMRTTLGLGSLATASTVNNSNWSGTALAVANGGTGSTTASDARTALGLAIGSNVQAYHGNLAAVAGLSLVADRLMYANGTGTLALATITSFARTLLDDADAATMRTTIGAIGLDSPAFTGTPTAPTAAPGTSTTQIATTAFVAAAVAAGGGGAGALVAANNLSDLANAATARTNLGIGNVENKSSSTIRGELTSSNVTTALTYTPTSVTGYTGAITPSALKTGLALVKGDVGLGNVDNTADTAKPVSTAQQTALDLKANLASPTLTGTPAAPTASAGTNTTQLATTAFVQAARPVKASIVYVIGDGTNVITTGVKGEIQVPFACTITGWTILANESGSIVVDVWKDTYANYPPVIGDVITASAKPTISSATKATSTTLTGWTTSIAEGDTLVFNVNSITICKRVVIQLQVTKT